MKELTEAELDKRKATNKKILKWFFGIFVVLMVLGSLGESSKDAVKNKEPNKNNSTSRVTSEFPFTVDEFIERYNTSLRTLGRDMSISPKDENDNGKSLTFMAMSDNQYFGFTLSANNNTRALQSIIFIASGDGSTKSGMDILFGAAAVVMAIEDPYMGSADQRAEILRDFRLSDGKLSELGELKIERNNIKYDLSISDTTGLWIIAEPM